MQESFDPYCQWLGFPEGKPPANHYELLGIPQFESDPEAIAHAADCLRGQIRSIRPGPHLAAWQQLLDEVNGAKACLLDPTSKASYDDGLRGAAAPPAPMPGPPMATPPLSPTAPMATPPMATPPGLANDDAPPAGNYPPPPTTPPPTAPWQGAWNSAPQPPMAEPGPVGGNYPPGYGNPPTQPPAYPAEPPTNPTHPPETSAYGSDASRPSGGVAVPPPGAATPYGNEPPAPYPPVEQMPDGAGADLPYVQSPAPYPQTPAPGYAPPPSAIPVPQAAYAEPDEAAGPEPAAEEEEGKFGEPVRRAPSPPARRTGSPVKALVTCVLLLVAGGLGYELYQVATQNRTEVVTKQPAGMLPQPPAHTKQPSTNPAPKPVVKPKPKPAPVEKPGPQEKPQPKEKPNPKEKPAPTEKPKPPPIDPAKQAVCQRELAEARISLSEEDLGGAQKHLDRAGANAQTPDQRSEVDRVRTLRSHLDQFWSGIRQSVAGLDGGEELVVGNTRVAVVEADQQHLILHVAGRNQAYQIEKIPPRLLLSLANRWFAKEPKSKVFIGAYLAVDPKGDRQRARQLWQEAAAGGVDIGDLPAELDKFEHLATPGAAPGAQQLAAPTDAAQLKQAEQLVHETYQKEFDGAKTVLDKFQLAKRLLGDAATTEDEPNARFVMFREARDLAVGIGEANLAFEAIDAMAAHYSIDSLKMKVEALNGASKKAKGLPDHREIAQLSMRLARSAVEAKRLDDAVRLASLGVDEARKARSAPLVKAAMDAQKYVRDHKGR